MNDKVTEVALDTVGKLATNVYSDVASPAARRVGTALESIFKVGLSPIALLDWGFEKSKDWLVAKVRERQSTVPDQFQQAPPQQVAMPALLAIAGASDSNELREIYAELLMKAMDTRTANMVHPSYVSILGQLTPQEALVFMSFRERANGSLFIDLPRTHRTKTPTIEDEFHKHCLDIGLQEPNSDIWLQNLLRLRLVELTTYTDAIYHRADYEEPEPSVETRDERHLTVTEYGKGFIEACAPPA
jgi:hypothetical protein